MWVRRAYYSPKEVVKMNTTLNPLSIERISGILTTIIASSTNHGLFGADLQAVKDAEQIVRNCWGVTDDPDATTLQLCNELERITRI
jgi:hypothetical protein